MNSNWDNKADRLILKADQSIRNAYSDLEDAIRYIETLDGNKTTTKKLLKHADKLSEMIDYIKYEFKR